jgi:4-amino-4-deoxychorismate lyase
MSSVTDKSTVANKGSAATKSLINGIKADYLNVNDRSIHYGDGLFETILCSDNKLYYWQQHFNRLQQSAEKLQFPCVDFQALEQQLLDDVSLLLAASNKSDHKKTIDHNNFSIKIILTRGIGERGYQYKKNSRLNRLVFLSEIDKDYSTLLSGKMSAGELLICKQQASINESLAGLKHLNRLENVLARNEWGGLVDNNRADNNKTSKNIIDGLMLNANGFVIEGSMSNLFAVKDKQLFTPDISQSGIKGVIREVVIDIAQAQNIKLSIKNITLEELKDMDEIFISNSLIGIKSVNKLDGVLFETHDLTNKIFDDLIETKDRHVQVI